MMSPSKWWRKNLKHEHNTDIVGYIISHFRWSELILIVIIIHVYVELCKSRIVPVRILSQKAVLHSVSSSSSTFTQITQQPTAFHLDLKAKYHESTVLPLGTVVYLRSASKTPSTRGRHHLRSVFCIHTASDHSGRNICRAQLQIQKQVQVNYHI